MQCVFFCLILFKIETANMKYMKFNENPPGGSEHVRGVRRLIAAFRFTQVLYERIVSPCLSLKLLPASACCTLTHKM